MEKRTSEGTVQGEREEDKFLWESTWLFHFLLFPPSLIREIKILKKLNHRNVIKLLDVFSDDNKQKMYIVLEYCVGGLQEMLDKTPKNKFPVWQAHKWVGVVSKLWAWSFDGCGF